MKHFSRLVSAVVPAVMVIGLAPAAGQAPANTDDFVEAARAAAGPSWVGLEAGPIPAGDDPVVRRFIAEAQSMTAAMAHGYPSPQSQPQAGEPVLCLWGLKVALRYELADSADSDVAPTHQRIRDNQAKYRDVITAGLLHSQRCIAAEARSLQEIAKAWASALSINEDGAVAALTVILRPHLLGAVDRYLSIFTPPLLPMAADERVLTHMESDFPDLMQPLSRKERADVVARLALVADTAPPAAAPRLRALGLQITKLECGAPCSASALPLAK